VAELRRATAPGSPHPAAPPVELPAHLRSVRSLASGGSASVLLARDRRRGDHVAVKVLGVPADAGAVLRRIEREARALARVGEHPGVASIRGCGADRFGTLWIATSFVVGPTLVDRVRAGELLDGSEAADVLGSVADALAAVHGAGVVHGDVSPANVVLGRLGPVLVDFGIGGVDTDVGDHAWTPVVVPPERLRGVRPRASGDVWSAAATVQWATHPETGVSEQFRRIVERCLTVRPAERPDARAVATMLRR